MTASGTAVRTDQARETVRKALDRFGPALRPMLTDVALVFLLSRVLFYLTAAIAPLFVPEYSGTLYQPWHTGAPLLIDASWRWDSGWYRSIAVAGYGWEPGSTNIAFFPLYPLLLKAILFIVPAAWIWISGVLISHLAFFGALIAVWFYAASFGGRPVARRTIYLLSIFPTAFFFSAAYTESLFLLTSGASLALMQRRRFGPAGVAGFCASLTRVFGVVLVVSGLLHLLQELLRERSRRSLPTLVRRGALLAAIPAGLGTFMLYLWLRFGDPLLFLKAQDIWDHNQAFPLVTLYNAVEWCLTTPEKSMSMVYVMAVINTVAILLALLMGLILLRRDLPGAVYALLAVLIILSSPVGANGLNSAARYVLTLFPLFVPLAIWARRRWVLVLLTIGFLPLNIVLTALFTRWYWVI